MEAVSSLFESAPLPYSYVNVPGPNAPNAERHLRFFVNKVITQLSEQGFKHAGFTRAKDGTPWNASWGRQYTADVYKTVKPYQKINHFAGAYFMGRKDQLHYRMSDLAKRAPEFGNFYPKSYLLPQDESRLRKVWQTRRFWIFKPSASSRGRGITVMDSEEESMPRSSGVVQIYIERPLLITGRKFDLRLYVLMTSILPIRIYIHDSGLARFATHEYHLEEGISDTKMHLTNFSLNKSDTEFHRSKRGEAESIENSKWSLGFFWEYLKGTGADVPAIQLRIEQAVISTIIAGSSAIRIEHEKLIKGHHTSYEMYGVDVMLDEAYSPHVIEVNISPAMSGMDSELDYKIKYRLMLELLNVARIIDCDSTVANPCPYIGAIDQAMKESMTQERISAVESYQVQPWDNPVFADFVYLRDYLEEYPRRAGFKQLFPVKENMNDYFRCFDRLRYQDIVFTSWVSMEPAEQLAVVEKHFDVYRSKLEEIKNSFR